MSAKGDHKKTLRRLAEQGWRIEHRTKHVLAFPPNRDLGPVRLANTPSSSRTRMNELAELKRKGYRP